MILSVQPASAQVTVVTTQPVVVQKPVFRDYPVVVTLENGQQVNIIVIMPTCNLYQVRKPGAVHVIPISG